ncbi:MAG: ACR3 family arsenite efflux transporter [Solirubrobacterales bacterium]|nr:ACR3 family arsenite efflux transporter [Solirubrobacterales bacterium]
MKSLSTLDRYLPLWIALAMAGGLALGSLLPGIESALDSLRIGTISLPIALGLILMMYPVLAKVRYEELGHLGGERRLMLSSLVLNWTVGPLLMFALAWILLADQPEFRTGLIIVGLARCIAMVLIWSDLACADREATALLVAINSLFQIVAYSLLGWFYLTALPDLLGLDSQGFHVSIWEIARTTLIFLGIPLLAGYVTRVISIRRRGTDWYETRFLPRIGPFALYGLLFTIVLLFAIQGEAITNQPLDVVRIAVPLLVYFALMFAVSFWAGWIMQIGYERTATLAFTAASNNFELAIAVAIGVFGAASGQALAGVVGPLIEVPVLVGLVYVALYLKRRLYPPETTDSAAVAATSGSSG